uniref:LolA-like domain-containing protein n=1 Tax=Rhipicephalus microplus TaxID=6941 RepID=A0A6M2CIR7_RHIMP
MNWFHMVSAVLGIVPSSLAARDWSVCQDPTYTCGPLPPLIPESYIMKYEWIDLVRNQTAWVEEYFDTESLRAKISVVLRGTKVTSIYDYFAETVTTYNSDRPGAKPSLDPESQDTCEIEEMSTYRGVRLPFGYKYRGERPRQSRMDSSYEALRFGGPYRVRYVRPATGEETRHLPADMFESCAYDKNEDATYRMRYYWSANASFLFPNGEVDVPIRIEQKGTYTNPDDDNNRGPWNTIRNVAWYQSDPEFSDEDFEVPRQTYCKNNANDREIALPPDTFNFRVEEVSFTLDETGSRVEELESTSFKEIWYDAIMQLARVDIIPSEEEKSWPLINESAGLDTMLSIVLDYRAEAAFVTHPSSGECVVRKLTSDFFLSEPNSTEGVEMLDPKKLFGFTKEHHFQGRYNIRGIEVETWTALINESLEEMNDTTRRHEISLMTDSEAERSGERDIEFVPVQESIYTDTHQATKDGTLEFRQHVVTKNYFKFTSEQPRLSVFQAPGCVSRHEARTFKVSFKGDDYKIIRQNKQVFVDALRGSLKDYGDVDTVMRIKVIGVAFYKRSNEIMAFFKILEPLSELQSKHAVTVDESLQKILERVQNGTLVFTLVLSDENDNTQLRTYQALKGSFAEAQWPKRKQTLYYQPQKAMDSTVRGKENQPAGQDAGYSAGAFAAIAATFTLVGIACGALAMWVYLNRRKRDGLIQNEERPIELQ